MDQIRIYLRIYLSSGRISYWDEILQRSVEVNFVRRKQFQRVFLFISLLLFFSNQMHEGYTATYWYLWYAFLIIYMIYDGLQLYIRTQYSNADIVAYGNLKFKERISFSGTLNFSIITFSIGCAYDYFRN